MTSGLLREQQPLEREARSSPSWIENRASRGWLPRFTVSELLAWRELVLILAIRDVKLRYNQTLFGIAWAVIQPLAGAALFSVTIGKLAHLHTDGIKYPVFAYSGFVVWTYIQTSVSGAADALVEDRAMVTKVYFPRLIAPVAAVFPALLDFIISLLVLGIFLLAYNIGVSPALVLLPVWVLATMALAASVGILLAALNVEYRDVRYTFPFLLQLWFFACPIVYSASSLHGAARLVYSLNPAVAVIDGFRWSAAGGPAPGPHDLMSLAAWIVLTGASLAYFGRVERRFADQV